MKSVLITDSIDPVCGFLLSEHDIAYDVHLKLTDAELIEIVPAYDGWIIRSGTRITAPLIEAATQLKVIGRAGVGVDNVDLQAATRQGVLVLNAPDGNTISTAEHTCAMLMSLARRIPGANRSLLGGEWNRKAFHGSEVYGKTLGVVGVGKIGREVIRRMQSFGMQVLGYDPMISSEVADRLGIEKVGMDEIFEQSDFITFHAPLTEQTRGLLNRQTLSRCKNGVCIVNCARGGIIDEAALLEALESGRVAGAALDVYGQEPPGVLQQALVSHPRVVATPHIAASTAEAQEKVARQVTEQVINALEGKPVMTPVNAEAIKMATQTEIQPFLHLTEKLGKVAVQLIGGSISRVAVRCHGDLVRRYAEVLTVAGLKGVLGEVVSRPVNFINARPIAEESGLQVVEERLDSRKDYTNLVELEIRSDRGRHVVAGTVFRGEQPRIVKIDSYDLEVVPEGHLLLYANEDRPGRLASVSGVLARAKINIGAVALGRKGPGLMALTVLTLDEALPEDVRAELRAIEGVIDIFVVNA
jgi:D-3-phosphoglycerate dehydrogenase / 2-oxoglutarate reductase